MKNEETRNNTKYLRLKLLYGVFAAFAVFDSAFVQIAVGGRSMGAEMLVISVKLCMVALLFCGVKAGRIAHMVFAPLLAAFFVALLGNGYPEKVARSTGISEELLTGLLLAGIVALVVSVVLLHVVPFFRAECRSFEEKCKDAKTQKDMLLAAILLLALGVFFAALEFVPKNVRLMSSEGVEGELTGAVVTIYENGGVTVEKNVREEKELLALTNAFAESKCIPMFRLREEERNTEGLLARIELSYGEETTRELLIYGTHLCLGTDGRNGLFENAFFVKGDGTEALVRRIVEVMNVR